MYRNYHFDELKTSKTRLLLPFFCNFSALLKRIVELLRKLKNDLRKASIRKYLLYRKMGEYELRLPSTSTLEFRAETNANRLYLVCTRLYVNGFLVTPIYVWECCRSSSTLTLDYRDTISVNRLCIVRALSPVICTTTAISTNQTQLI